MQKSLEYLLYFGEIGLRNRQKFPSCNGLPVCISPLCWSTTSRHILRRQKMVMTVFILGGLLVVNSV